MIKVVNKRKLKDSGIYIGRPSVYGNPFEIGKDGTREEVIEKYKEWMVKELKSNSAFYDNMKFLVELSEKQDLNLICWCAPLACHGDIIKFWVENNTP